jgi:3-isopropylmalate/(R)-2-methylmalate dehydratase small subunit
MNSKVQRLTGRGIPLPGNDVDTDRIIPARFMKCITFEGLGQYAFYDQRFDEKGTPKAHPFNDERYRGGSILLVGKNFGCGSSREHAPQALQKFGVKAIVGQSFAEIFAGNCTVMGIPVVTAPQEAMDGLMAAVERAPATEITLDLQAMDVRAGERTVKVSMPASSRHSLVNGTWDSTAILLANREKIAQTAAAIPYLNGFRSRGSAA